MRASQIMQDLPVYFANEAAMVAIRQVAHDDLPGFVVIDPHTQWLTALSLMDLLGLLLPEYVRQSQAIALVYDEESADGLAQRAAGVSLGELLCAHDRRGAEVSADATLVEMAEMMTRLRSPILLVRGADPRHTLRQAPVVTAESVFKALLRPVAGDGSQAG